jgi:hypothetical protein
MFAFFFSVGCYKEEEKEKKILLMSEQILIGSLDSPMTRHSEKDFVFAARFLGEMKGINKDELVYIKIPEEAKFPFTKGEIISVEINRSRIDLPLSINYGGTDYFLSSAKVFDLKSAKKSNQIISSDSK